MKINREHVHSKYNGHCAYCGQEITLKQMQVDHYYPQRMPTLAAHYGGFTDVNHIDNLMPSCRQCNHYKRGNGPDSWRVAMATLHERIEKIYINRVAVNFGMVTIKPWDGKFYFEKINRL
jgi:5-methylcytosine-specific restriction endonuclease McrA